MTPSVHLWRHARLACMTNDRPWGWVEHGALLTQSERILWVGPESDRPQHLQADTQHDLQGALVTPGLIDAHTHLVYGGDRAHEFELRLQGASYETIAKAGGGIRSTVAATRAASDEQLLSSALQRARILMAGGVSTPSRTWAMDRSSRSSAVRAASVAVSFATTCML
jgi:imidazolonepropionase